MKILVIRNDKIGDFMLAWPALSLLKRRYPDAEITALVPGYTAPLAEQCEWIDEVLLDDEKGSSIRDVFSLASRIRKHQFDVSISLFSQTRTSLAVYLAGISRRFGPATKIAQVFLNNRLRQKRSQSEKPEYEYNIDLVEYFIGKNSDSHGSPSTPPYLRFDTDEIAAIKAGYLDSHFISEDHRLIFIHPGTGGSAINLSLEQYAELARTISQQGNIYIVITAGPGELDIAETLSGMISHTEHHVHHSTGSIIDFSKLIDISDVFISGSTGPLHIAGALDRCTVAFYPARRSATALRWQTINSEEKRLHFSPEKFTGQNDMQQIDVSKAAVQIIDRFLR